MPRRPRVVLVNYCQVTNTEESLYTLISNLFKTYIMVNNSCNILLTLHYILFF